MIPTSAVPKHLLIPKLILCQEATDAFVQLENISDGLNFISSVCMELQSDAECLLTGTQSEVARNPAILVQKS
jgi:hypothetical protein